MADTTQATVAVEGTDLFAEFRRLSPKVTGGLVRMRQESYAGGVVPAKYKLLTAMVVSVAIRCEPCIRAYVKMAVDAGTTEAELIEFLNVAVTMQGCPGEEWALKAFQAHREIAQEHSVTSAPSCCH